MVLQILFDEVKPNKREKELEGTAFLVLGTGGEVLVVVCGSAKPM